MSGDQAYGSEFATRIKTILGNFPPGKLPPIGKLPSVKTATQGKLHPGVYWKIKMKFY